MGLFAKKKEEKPEEEIPEDPSFENVPVAKPGQQPPEQLSAVSGAAASGMIVAEVEKLKAQFTSFYEMQKVTAERFTRINEQIGEIRGMILDRDRAAQQLEAKATQAVDLVQSVQPEKLMSEVRRQDSKVEALRGVIESNETLVKSALTEIRDLRNTIASFKGMEETVKLYDEVKKEIFEIKKINASTERNADKVNTIFAELQKSYTELKKAADRVNDLEKSFKQLAADVDALKVRNATFASRKEFEDLINRFNQFEKQASDVLVLINKKLTKFENDLTQQFATKLEQVEKLLTGFEILAQKTPDLDKYFNLLKQEAKKASTPPKVEKLKELGQEEKAPFPPKEKAKEKEVGIVGTILSKVKK